MCLTFLKYFFQFLYKCVCEAKEKTSKYKGVSWSNKQKKWYVRLIANDGKQKYGGSFSDELDAAKKVNQLCAELEIPEKNPGVGMMSNRQWKVTLRVIQKI